MTSDVLQKVAITGSSGFYGRALVRSLRERIPGIRILGLDVVEPVEVGLDEFIRCDVLSGDLLAHLDRFQPDTVVHLAFVVNPMRDEQRMHRINVEGTRNVLRAVSEVKPARLLVSSSATAYGAWHDNPLPMLEDQPLRVRDEYRYAIDKVAVEQMLEEFRLGHPGIAVSWTRPTLIYGEGLANYLTRFILRGPLIILPDGHDTPMQFVHLHDVAEATLEILRRNAEGPFNIAPPDWITLSDLARWSRRFTLRIPLSVCRGVTKVWWGLRFPIFHFPDGLWLFIRYHWVVHPRRLTEELGYRFRYSTGETIQQLLDEAGKLCSQMKSSRELGESQSRTQSEGSSSTD